MTQRDSHPDLVPASVKEYPYIISHPEEEELLSHFKRLHWRQVKMHGIVAKRQVVHFGLDYSFTKRQVQPTDSAPAFLHSVMGRAACTMKFRREGFGLYQVDLPPRGIYIFKDEARWLWQHTISSHQEERFSITFRTLKKA